jgi:predicted CXXCH cytochrome family protein
VSGIRAALASLGRRIGRPRGVLGWLKYGAVAVGLAILLVALVAVGVVAAATFYDQYGRHDARNAREWASLTPQYAADSSLCARCHVTEYTKWSGSEHIVVGCQTCHGPLAAHVATAPVPESAEAIDQSEAGEASPIPVEGAPRPIPPTDALCTVCHAARLGQPDAFHSVDPDKHFPGTSCLQCHDVHTAIAVPPPRVMHTLEGIPACTTCHSTSTTNGVRPLPAGHRLSEDSVCLGCHKPGAGAPRQIPLPTANP